MAVTAVVNNMTVTANVNRYGRSLGSGPSCYLAEKLKVERRVLGGLVLQVIHHVAAVGYLLMGGAER